MCRGSVTAAATAAAAFYVKPMGSGAARPPLVEAALFAGPSRDEMRYAGALTLHPDELAELRRRLNRPAPDVLAQCESCGRSWGFTRLPAVGWRCPRSLGGCGHYQKIKPRKGSADGNPEDHL